jgi:ADP-ribose pyrophosphatase
VVEHPGAVGVVALDTEGRVLMIRQYRHPVGRMLWELPAGLRDVAGEPLLQTARRELLEETGYRARDWHVLADYFSSPGIITERLRVFLARGLEEVPAADRDFVPENEEAHLTLDWVPLEHAVSRVLAGDLHNGVAVVGLLAAHTARQNGFAALRDAEAPEN